MFEVFQDHTEWTLGGDVGTAATETTNHLQGTGCLDLDKDGTSTALGTATKKLRCPWDLRHYILASQSRNLKVRVYHADFTNLDAFRFRLVFRFDSSGAPTIYDTFEFTSFTGAQWNTLSLPVNSPTSSTGSPTSAHRAMVVGYQIELEMGAAANTLTTLLVDAAEIDGASPPAAALIYDQSTLLLPAFNVWNRLRREEMLQLIAEEASEITFLGGKEGIRCGVEQARATTAADAYLYGAEDYLRTFGQIAANENGWGAAWPANERVNTTISVAASQGATSLTLASTKDVALLGDACSIRLGPNDSRYVERAAIVSRSGSVVTLDRPLAFAHESGTAVRSLNYYPSLAKMGTEHAVTETGKAVRFEIEAVETA